MNDPKTPATVTIPAELAFGILAYLRGRPYAEVAQGVAQLEAALAPHVAPAADSAAA